MISRCVTCTWIIINTSCLFLPGALDQARFKMGGYCEVCKMAVTYIDGILEKNATEAQIEDAVRKVCSFLPDSLQGEVRTPGLCNSVPPSCHSPPLTAVCFPSPVRPAGGAVRAGAHPAAAPDAGPGLCVPGKHTRTKPSLLYRYYNSLSVSN